MATAAVAYPTTAFSHTDDLHSRSYIPRTKSGSTYGKLTNDAISKIGREFRRRMKKKEEESTRAPVTSEFPTRLSPSRATSSRDADTSSYLSKYSARSRPQPRSSDEISTISQEYQRRMEEKMKKKKKNRTSRSSGRESSKYQSPSRTTTSLESQTSPYASGLSTNPQKQSPRKSVHWDEGSIVPGNTGFDDHGSDFNKRKNHEWKSFNSRAPKLKLKAQKDIVKSHKSTLGKAFHKIRKDPDWTHVPTCSETLKSRFPTLYKYESRPTKGTFHDSSSGMTLEETQTQWDEENDERMEAKLKPLSEVTGPLSKTGSRAIMLKTMSEEDQRTWANDAKTMFDKYMSVICRDEAERARYLGSSNEKSFEGMRTLQQQMSENRSLARRKRANKVNQKSQKSHRVTVPTTYDDSLYASIMSGEAGDLSTRKWMTDREKTEVYPDLWEDDLMSMIKDSEADEATQRRFRRQVEKMRSSGQSVVRPLTETGWRSAYRDIVKRRNDTSRRLSRHGGSGSGRRSRRSSKSRSSDYSDSDADSGYGSSEGSYE